MFYEEIESQPNVNLPDSIRVKIENESQLNEEELEIYRNLYYIDEKEKHSKKFLQVETQTEGVLAQENKDFDEKDSLIRNSEQIDLTANFLVKSGNFQDSQRLKLIVEKETQTEQFENQEIGFDEIKNFLSLDDSNEVKSLLDTLDENISFSGNSASSDSLKEEIVLSVQNLNSHDFENSLKNKQEIEDFNEKNEKSKDFDEEIKDLKDFDEKIEKVLENNKKHSPNFHSDHKRLDIEEVKSDKLSEEKDKKFENNSQTKKKKRKKSKNSKNSKNQNLVNLKNKSKFNSIQEISIEEDIDSAKIVSEKTNQNSVNYNVNITDENYTFKRKSKPETASKYSENLGILDNLENSKHSSTSESLENIEISDSSDDSENTKNLEDSKAKKYEEKTENLDNLKNHTKNLKNESPKNIEDIKITNKTETNEEIENPNIEKSESQNKKTYTYNVENKDKVLITKFSSNFKIKRDSYMSSELERPLKRKSTSSNNKKQNGIIKEFIKSKLGTNIKKITQEVLKNLNSKKQELDELTKMIKAKQEMLKEYDREDEKLLIKQESIHKRRVSERDVSKNNPINATNKRNPKNQSFLGLKFEQNSPKIVEGPSSLNEFEEFYEEIQIPEEYDPES